jgi:hypothetical protein
MMGASSVGGIGLGRASCRLPSERGARRGMSTLCPFLGEEVGFFIGFMLYFAMTSCFTRVSLKYCHRLAIAPRTDVLPRGRWPTIS